MQYDAEMRFSCLVALGSVLALPACSAGNTRALSVDLRTDYVPGLEFVAVRVDALVDRPDGGSTTAATQDHAALETDAFVTGLRVADLSLPIGDYHVRARLLAASGAVVAERVSQVHFAGNLAITLVVTRSCRTVVCAAGQACSGGVCVDPMCLAGGCTPQCTSDTSCRPVATCATGRCVSGTCFSSVTAGACASTEWCNPDVGCVRRDAPVPDAGPLPDSGMPVDAGSGMCACGSHNCGDDGCGHSCGSCSGTQSCSGGTCTDNPPDCSGLSCGASHNGVGGPDACGTCGSTQMCSGGTCVDMPPDCSGLSCGPSHNGTGGPDACGTCGTGFTCSGGACQCGGDGAGCVPGSCCGSFACLGSGGSTCCPSVGQPCGSGCCPGRLCVGGTCCVVLGDGCSSDGQCCNYPAHQCVSSRCCVVLGNGCSSGGQCCSGTCTSGTCR